MAFGDSRILKMSSVGNKLMLLTYDKNNNLLFKVRGFSALFLIDFSNERVKLLKGYMPKSKKKKLRKFIYEHYDLVF